MGDRLPQREVRRSTMASAPPPPTTKPLMAEGPAEGEWEEDAGMGAAAAERRREKAMEREKAKLANDQSEPHVTGPLQKKPVGGVAVMPVGADLISKFRKDKVKEDAPTPPSKKPEVLVKTTSRRIGSSDDEDEAFLRHSGPGSGPVSPNSAFTRPYTYESNVDDHSRRKFEPQGVGFRYDAHNAGHSQQPKSPNGSNSSGKRNVGVAYSYIGGEESKVAEASKGLRNTSPIPVPIPTVPTTRTASPARTVSPILISSPARTAPADQEAVEIEINPVTMDYVESAGLKSQRDAAAKALSEDGKDSQDTKLDKANAAKAKGKDKEKEKEKQKEKAKEKAKEKELAKEKAKEKEKEKARAKAEAKAKAKAKAKEKETEKASAKAAATAKAKAKA